MVKADVRRDYYADLGLAPNAESEDIKKQFRKLGEQARHWRLDKETPLTIIHSPQVPSR